MMITISKTGALARGTLLAALLLASSQAVRGAGSFDDLPLAPDSYWNGESKWDDAGNPYPPSPAESPHNYDSSVATTGFSFNNRFSANTFGDTPPYSNWTSWSAFSYSNMTDTTTPGAGNQYSAYAGAADSGDTFGVGYDTAWGGLTPTITFPQELAPVRLKLTNISYAALSMKDGDAFTDPMAEGDWFKVTLSAKDGDGQATGNPIGVMLGAYPAGGTRKIVDEWVSVDLAQLGTSVKSVEFSVESWDASAGGAAQWPSYFALDSAIPEPTALSLLALGGAGFLQRRRQRGR